MDASLDLAQEAADRGALREALRSVIDPEIGIDIVTLDLLRGFEFTPERVTVLMVLTTPFCPYAPELFAEIRRVAEEMVDRPVEVRALAEAWTPPDEVKVLLGMPGSW